MKGFDPKFADLPDYIIGITREIWEEDGVDTLHDYYAPDIPVRSPDGVIHGNLNIIRDTKATLQQFPGRQLLAEDVIWSGDEDKGFMSSHRVLSLATHEGTGSFGEATGVQVKYRTIADCAVRNNQVYDEWLVRDRGAVVRQLGLDPQRFAADTIEAEGGPETARRPLNKQSDVPGPYEGTGNDLEPGKRYEAMIHDLMDGKLSVIPEEYDRAVHLELPGGQTRHSHQAAHDFWEGLRAAFPDAEFEVHHRIGRLDDGMSPRAALRWSLDGIHSGGGMFGEPSGAPVHIMGMGHAEYGPWGLRREYVIIDEVAVWKQILLHTG